MSKLAIEVKALSKRYQIGQIGTGTLSHDLNRWLSHLLRKKKTSQPGNQNYSWAIRDINFQISQGDVVGIIGKNGAGKSTLLKILSKVTGPTEGKIRTRGRIASLLEVGTGFHLEMTGRENIYMNGTIMGMTKKEITERIGEIIDFAGINKYVDTPVKRYSSGMTVRLGFAIAAHLEPEILIVDEVLAVGDAEFQKKAIGKMQDVSQKEGRTVLFVSHNMAAVENLCNKGIVLDKGTNVYEGTATEAIKHYISLNAKRSDIPLSNRVDRVGSGQLIFDHINFFDSEGKRQEQFLEGESITIEISYQITDSNFDFTGTHFSIQLSDIYGHIIFDSYNDIVGTTFDNTEILTGKVITIELKKVALRAGIYNISCDFVQGNKYIDQVDNATQIQIIGGTPYNYSRSIRSGVTAIETHWSIK